MADNSMKVQDELNEKLRRLEVYIKKLRHVAVAFSGGVDSAFLLKVSHEVLKDCAFAVTANPCSFPGKELEDAKIFCEKEGICQVFFDFDELSLSGFAENPRNRCYICKKALFERMKEAAVNNGNAVLVEGSNMDDEGDYRPGLKAIAELGVLSPLRACGLTKHDIRTLSKEMGLPTWNKPSMACLSSRFVYGEKITKEKLFMVERAEELLHDLGFYQVRVRVHGEMARIEVMPEEFGKIMEESVRQTIAGKLETYGFSYVALDMKGYRTGSMNEILEHE